MILDGAGAVCVALEVADAGGEPLQGGLRDLRIAVAAVLSDEQVADLVDEAHGKEGAGVNGFGAG